MSEFESSCEIYPQVKRITNKASLETSPVGCTPFQKVVMGIVESFPSLNDEICETLLKLIVDKGILSHRMDDNQTFVGKLAGEVKRELCKLLSIH